MAVDQTKAEGEVKQARAAPPQESPQAPIQLEVPLARKEFDQFLGAFMQRTGISDRKRAAILATIALKDLGMDPVANLEETVKTTQFLTSVLQILPDAGEITAATKDVIAAEGVSKVGKQLIEGPTAEDRMEKMMQTVMPYMMIAKILGGGGGDESSLRKEFQDFKAEFTTMLKDKAIEDKFAELKTIIASKPSGDTDIGKKFDELKDVLVQTKKDEQIAALQAILEKQGQDLSARLDTLSQQPKGDGSKGFTDDVTDFVNRATKFKEGLDTLEALKGDTSIKGEDRFSKLLQFGEKIWKGVQDIAKTARQPAPPRTEVKTAPVPGEAEPAPRETVITQPVPTPPAEVKPAEAPKPEEEQPKQ
jgi:uncharacterized protein YukE